MIFLIVSPVVRRKKLDYNRLKYHIFAFAFIFLLATIFPYLALFHNCGKITQGSEEFKILKDINYVGQKISGYKKPIEKNSYEKKWAQKLQEIESKNYSTGAKRAEKRHIWPWEPLTSWNNFTQANGLYLKKFAGGNTSKELADTMNFLLFQKN